jgi:zinc D-Ala-D-Ala dipeptidase
VSETAALRGAGPAVECGEPLAEVASPGIAVLHSYARAGRRHAVDRQWLRAGTLTRLRQAAAGLPRGFGFAVFDAWRPLELQRELFDVTGPGETDFVAPPSEDPATPPPHLTGGTVDLTLSWRGTPLALGTTFDEFTDSAATTAFEDTPGAVRALRRLLYHTLRQQGFVVLAEEWWHFEFGTRLWSALTGRPARYGPTAPVMPGRGG